MSCDWESEHGWCQYPGRTRWMNSRVRFKSLERYVAEPTNIKCADMLERCKL